MIVSSIEMAIIVELHENQIYQKGYISSNNDDNYYAKLAILTIMHFKKGYQSTWKIFAGHTIFHSTSSR
jgi:hypothetical protein